MEQYKNKEVLKGLFDIVDDVNLSNYDLDIKGEAFEYFINYGNTSSDMGEYFTPRHLVRFMVMLLDEAFIYNREQLFGKTYFDPTCGTGGFLIEVFKHLKNELKNTKKDTPENIKKLKEKSVYGNELNLRSSEIAKMNMILTGDGHSNINQGDFIAIKDERKNEYDVSIGNPPFGNNREWEFVDGFLKDVKVGGYSIFLVPEGVLFKADKNFVEIRKTLLNKGKLLKVISLPQGAFLPYAGVKTNIVFWKNEIQEKDYNIEFIDIKNDGFSLDANRKELKNSDLTNYFESKQKLIDNGQIWNVNSSQIYDKTKLNQLELEKSKLELEAKESIKKLDIMKKQLKQIDNKEEKEQKESKILEFQEKLENIKKQTKKIITNLQTFNIDLTVNFNKKVNDNKNYTKTIKLGKLCDILNGYAFDSKNFNIETGYPLIRIRNIKTNHTDTMYNGEYNEKYIIKNGDIIIGMDGEFNIGKWQGGDALLNQRVCKLQNFRDCLPDFLYYIIKKPLKAIEDKTSFVTVKHISSKQIFGIEIPFLTLDEQKKFLEEIYNIENQIKKNKLEIERFYKELEDKTNNIF